MPKRMLIDASHPEETRVVVVDGQRVEEFDFEAASKRPLKGNIYLAKITRVEPSLQAAFVEYGGNRQGFLAFSEIHPDYYQIPVADREALLAEQQEEARRRADEEFESVATGTAIKEDLEAEDEDVEESTDSAESVGGDDNRAAANRTDDDPPPDEDNSAGEEPSYELEQSFSAGDEPAHAVENAGDGPVEGTAPDESRSQPEQASHSQRPPQRWVRRRHYKIQEVIKRKQVMLVQAVKEERGTKGAALTTYLSLAGRYCVLMPNTPRGGGISRKITNLADRNRLKSAAATLELPEGMGVIIRTAGANRTKLEIKRDYEYLLRLWDRIRELTLKSNAPACVYEEGDIVKRAIRDLYSKDVTEIAVEGEEAYRNAKEFMRMLMPSHAKNIKQYRDTIPIFQRHRVEAQLDAMFQPSVTLKSGGYIVIDQTEALVSIDVNSGRATREHSIEETAHKTNLEAADEVARQLRLRDLAGLIVIDFIDMEDARNDRDVEKRLRDATKYDRARVQIGKISQFGLLEMSRQRLRAGVVAGSTVPCPHCGGQGIVRSVESTALRLLRALDEEGQRGRAAAITVRVANDVALYTLNQKRRELARIEGDYGLSIAFEPSSNLMAGSFDLERIAARGHAPQKPVVSAETGFATPTDISEPIEEPSETSEPAAGAGQNDGAPQLDAPKKRRRRRRGRGHLTTMQEPIPSVNAQDDEDEPATDQANSSEKTGPAIPPEADAQQSETRAAIDSAAARSHRRRRRRRKPRSSAPAGSSEAPTREALATEEPAPENAYTGERLYERSQIAPNAPSEPVWSLIGEMAAAPIGAQDDRRPPGESSAQQTMPPVSGSDLPEPRAAGSDELQQPQQKGWWQRQFRKD